MPKICEYKRLQCVDLINKGLSQRKVADQLQISRGGVRNIMKKFKSSGIIADVPKTGRPRKLSVKKQRLIIIKSKLNPRWTANMLRSDGNINHLVSVDTVKRILRRAKLFGRVAVKKPFLSKINKIKRLKWCREKQSWSSVNWKRIIFSDESKIELHSKSRQYVRRQVGSGLRPSMVQTTKKFSPYVMVWGAVRADGKRALAFCDENVNQHFYQQLLRENLPSIYSIRYFFQQDGAKAHTATSTIDFLQANQIRQLQNWPPQSPDLSIIENLWDILKQKVRRRNCRNIFELKSTILDEWNNISNDEILNLYESIPRRIRAVIRAGGSNTKY